MTDHYLDGWLSRTRGVIGRYPDQGDRYLFTWPDVGERSIHMIGVTRSLVVEWWVDDDMVAKETLDPWVGHATHPADTVIEHPPHIVIV